MIKYYLAAQFPRYLASRLRLVGASGSEQNLSSVTSDTVWEWWTVDNGHTLGVNKNCTLVSVNFSAQDASILKISVPIIKRRS